MTSMGEAEIVVASVKPCAFDGTWRYVQNAVLCACHLQLDVQALNGLAKGGFRGTVCGE